MKRLIIIFLLLATTAVPISLRGQNDAEYNSEQLALRTDLFNFLKEEGFIPELDSDGDIKFKSEGQPYFISISKTDKNPMYVVLYRIFSNPDEYSEETVAMASTKLNFYKGVKVLCFEKSFRIGAELYVRDAEPVKSAFYKLIEIIDSVKSDFLDECKNVGTISSSSGSYNISEIPFIITKMEVANVEYNGDIIQDYGSTIYDFKTKYLKPRITIKPFKTSGSYTVYVKLYKDNVLQRNTSSSPEDSTFSNSVTISGSSNQTVELSGWGSNNAGQWGIGTYRYEVWYNDYCLGSKKFKVF
ncbi:MAG: hypothetical protein ACI358_09490 [Candidatus Limimorpha sp.]